MYKNKWYFPSLKKIPIFPNAPFLWEKFEPPTLLRKFWKLEPPTPPPSPLPHPIYKKQKRGSKHLMLMYYLCNFYLFWLIFKINLFSWLTCHYYSVSKNILHKCYNRNISTIKIQNSSPARILEVKQSELIKEWENIITNWKRLSNTRPWKHQRVWGSTPENFCNIPASFTVSLEKVLPVLKLKKNCCIYEHFFS